MGQHMKPSSRIITILQHNLRLNTEKGNKIWLKVQECGLHILIINVLMNI